MMHVYINFFSNHDFFYIKFLIFGSGYESSVRIQESGSVSKCHGSWPLAKKEKKNRKYNWSAIATVCPDTHLDKMQDWIRIETFFIQFSTGTGRIY